MGLDDHKVEKLNNWLKSKKVKWRCSSCGHSDWGAGDIVSVPKFDSFSGIVIGGETIPMIQLICNNCAYIRFYAAIPMGLLEDDTR